MGFPPPLRNTALHSDETRPMAQFFSPASTFLGKNTPKIDPMEAWGKCTRPMGPSFSWMKQSAQFIPPKISPMELAIGNSNLSNSGKCLRSIREKLIFRGCTPFFSTKKKKSPNITTPEPPKKKTTPRKKFWNQPSKSTTPTTSGTPKRCTPVW